jgi:hypothetical protein
MTRVDRVFFMDFNQYVLVVVNFLSEPQCLLSQKLTLHSSVAHGYSGTGMGQMHDFLYSRYASSTPMIEKSLSSSKPRLN